MRDTVRVAKTLFTCAAGSVVLLLSGSPTTAVDIQQAPTGAQSLTIRLMRDGLRSNRRVVVVYRDWFYCYPPTGEIIRVPAGYTSDFASVPPAAQGIIPAWGRQNEAAVVHDWLFAVGEVDGFSHANAVFRYALREQGVSWFRATIMHWAVSTPIGRRAYGSRNWDAEFRDPETLDPVVNWLPRPSRSAVGISPTSCRDWDLEVGPFAAAHPSRPPQG